MNASLPKLDDLDRAILKTLMADARTPYAEMAKQFDVSPATIHVRIEKMKSADIIEGTEVIINTKKLGYDVCCFIGINLNAARDYHSALEKLNALDEVVEAYYTTGAYNIFVKLMCKSIEELQFVLIDKLQAIDEVQSTETLISLQNPINRNDKSSKIFYKKCTKKANRSVGLMFLLNLRRNTRMAQQCVDLWLAATEALKQLHWLFTAPHF